MRKERVGKNIGFYNEDVDNIFGKTRETSQPAPLRTRAAEIHNISEKRHRDGINEKMKTLQKLIPRCNKSDKASMLDDAIEHLKLLQLQVQQYNMVQMMLQNSQRYMGYMSNLGMGMAMGRPLVEMQRPMMPSGSLMPYPTMMLPHMLVVTHS